MKNSYLMCGATAVTLLVGAQPGRVLAQDAQPSGSRSGVEEIIVTARRKEERLQDVPISISVLTQEQLANRNIVSAGDIATYTPSLSANSRFGSENTSFAIRGFTQDNGTAPSVGVYFADVVAPRAGGGTTLGNGAGPGQFFDLQNVQVLKGPQGTLFGRNTTGGAILLVPQKPTGEFEGYVEGTGGNYDMRRLQGVVNVPVTDNVRVRLGVDGQERDGYLKNRSGIGPGDFADIGYWAARGSIVADLTPNLENYTIATYSRSATNGFLPTMAWCNPASTRPEAAFGCAQLQRARNNDYGYYDVENGVVDPEQVIEQWQLINTTTWSVSDTLTIKNIISYGEFREDFRSAVYGDNLVVTSGANAGRSFTRVLSNPYPGRHNAAQSTFTEELQVQGRISDDRLIWQAGGYAELSDPLGFSGALTPAYSICPDTNALNCISPGVTGATASASGRSARTYYEDYGLYAQGTYKLTEQISMTTGVRYTWDYTKAIARHINFSGLPITSLPARGTCLDALTFGRPGTGTNVNRTEESCETAFEQRSDKPTWVIDLDYKPIEDTLLYGKYGRGYRQGSIKSDASGLESFEPEKLDTYEIGIKTSFRGPVPGIFNVAAFYNDFTDQQLSASAQPCCGNPNPTPAQIIVNAGKSTIKGVEVETSIDLFESFTLDGSYTYLDTELKSFTPPADSPLYSTPTLNGSRVGFPLSLSPKHKYTVTGTYRLPLDENIGRISFGATFIHIDENYSTFQDTPLVALTGGRDLGLLPAVDLLNLNLNWNSVARTPMDLSLFVTNVTEEEYRASVFGGLPSFGFESMAVNEPRMYGLRLKYSFGD